MEINNNTSKQHLERILTINQQVIIIIITYKQGNCFACQKEKEIRLISHKQIWIGTTPTYQEKKYCWSCALANLYKLEQSNYQIEKKAQIIKELRAELHKYPATTISH